MRDVLFVLCLLLLPTSTATAQVQRIWLTHRTNDPSKIVVNWETKEPGNSFVRYGLSQTYTSSVAVDEAVTLHHVEIPVPERDTTYHYSVGTGNQASADATFKAYPSRDRRITSGFRAEVGYTGGWRYSIFLTPHSRQ